MYMYKCCGFVPRKGLRFERLDLVDEESRQVNVFYRTRTSFSCTMLLSPNMVVKTSSRRSESSGTFLSPTTSGSAAGNAPNPGQLLPNFSTIPSGEIVQKVLIELDKLQKALTSEYRTQYSVFNDRVQLLNGQYKIAAKISYSYSQTILMQNINNQTLTNV